MKRRIVEATGYSVRTDAEQEELLTVQQFNNDLWDAGSLERQAVVNAHNRQIDRHVAKAEWDSLSWVDKVKRSIFGRGE